MEVESITSPGWSMVIIVTDCTGFKYSWKPIMAKSQETMSPDESVPKVKFATYMFGSDGRSWYTPSFIPKFRSVVEGDPS